MSDQPCCAHSRLSLVPLRHPDGTYSDQWVCGGCPATFILRPVGGTSRLVPVEFKESTEEMAFGIFQSMDKQAAELRRELRETREANDGLAILAQKTAKAAAQWAEEFRKARDELSAVQEREAKGVEVFDGIVAELRVQLQRADREVQRLTNLVNQQAERDAASTIDHFRQRAERLERALKALADFDPQDSLKEGWTGGWCWCGGSVRHRAPCLQARAALDFSATERKS